MLGSMKDVIERLEKQKAAIEQALSILREFENGSTAELPTPKTPKPTGPVKKAAKKKRTMSEEARKNIAEAARKRWAAAKKANSKKLLKAAA